MDPIELERAKASAARINAWGLWALSLVAMGATWASIDVRDWSMGAAFTAVMLMLAWAAGSERAEQRQAEQHVAWLEGAWMDEWIGAWR